MSLSEVVRGLISREMAARTDQSGGVLALAGLLDDGTVQGADHDWLLAEAVLGETEPAGTAVPDALP